MAQTVFLWYCGLYLCVLQSSVIYCSSFLRAVKCVVKAVDLVSHITTLTLVDVMWMRCGHSSPADADLWVVTWCGFPPGFCGDDLDFVKIGTCLMSREHFSPPASPPTLVILLSWSWNPASYVFFLKYHKYQVAWFIGLAERDHKERKVSANDRPDCKRVEIYPVAIIRSTKPQSASAPTSALKLKSPSSKYFANCKRKPIY